MAMVKHNVRSSRKGCARCGEGGPSSPHKLYWWHDTEKSPNYSRPCSQGSEACEKAGIAGRPASWVLANEFGIPHVCQDKRRDEFGQAPKTPSYLEETETPKPVEETPKPVETLTETPKTGNGDQAAEELVGIIKRLAGSAVDESKVRTIVSETFDDKGREILSDLQEKVEAALANVQVPTRVQVVTEHEVRDIPHTVHKVFPEVLTWANAGCHVALVGPAGTGKSTIPQHVAEALGMDYGSISLSATKPISELTGYRDAMGNYHSTAFRRICEAGGVFNFDEMDSANPNTLTVVNEMLSNKRMEFPDGPVAMHPNTLIFACMNTYGTGADRQYVGRLQLDAATTDRFVFVEVPVDEAIETSVSVALAGEGKEEEVRRLLGVVRQIRANAQNLRLQVAITPRASYFGARGLANGLAWDRVISAAVRKGISDQDWTRVTEGVRV